MSFRAKLIIAFSSVMFMAIIFSTSWLSSRLEDGLKESTVAQLKGFAQAGKYVLETQSLANSHDGLDRFCDGLGQATDTRVTVIAQDGRVLGDAKVPFSDLETLENHGQRPEVLEAQTKGFGIAWRYSATVQRDMVYVALPYRGASGQGTLRVSRGMQAVQSLIGHFDTIVLIAAIIALGLALPFSFVASNLLSRNLRQLRIKLRRVRASAEEPPLLGPIGDDVSFIERSIDKMAKELDDALTSVVTERDRMEDVLRALESAVIVTDDRSRIVLSNPAARNLFDQGHKVVGRPLADVVRVSEIHDVIRDKMGPNGAVVEFELLTPTRHACLGRITRQSATNGLLLVVHDMTEIRHLETVRSDFVANVSHELRTPVSVIQVNTETLLAGAHEDPEARTMFLAAIARNTERLGNLINDLLDLTRIETQGLEARREPVLVELAVSQVVEYLTPKAQERQQGLEAHIPTGLSCLADALALEQVLTNYVDNAIKYTPIGGTIRIQAKATKEHIRIDVVDTGPGIAPELRERVFERFFRVDTGRSRAMGGTGLGLSIVKNLVAQMDGQVGVEAAPHGGSSFYVLLPRATETQGGDAP